MTLKEHIDDIRNQLKEGAFPTEAAVSFGIVQRLLEPLGWPKFTPQVIIPEYGVEGQRVDFALCHPPGKPLVFVEVKKVGNLDGTEEQLFGYAFRRGVPIAILTDGQKWRFFYPSGQGEYRERKVYELDLIESESAESVDRLTRYLNYKAIQTGEAVKAIEEDYRNASKQREIEARLPEVWNKLLQDQEKNEYLLLAVMEKAKDMVGHEPTEEQVLTFLISLGSEAVSDRKVVTSQVESKSSSSDSESKTSSVDLASNTSSSRSKSKAQRLIVTMPNGKVINHYYAKDTFVEALEKLGLDEVNGIRSQTVSTEPFKNLPNSKYTIRDGFYINLNNGTPEKKRILGIIAKDLGIQLKIEIVEK
ncbi:hypothetical protein C6497_17255 [Candidatus Poribacteria bacterium]|nr:MAG: hypothetical protein C6497_17255 [Candidatus Poribacteria bacterium]